MLTNARPVLRRNRSLAALVCAKTMEIEGLQYPNNAIFKELVFYAGMYQRPEGKWSNEDPYNCSVE